jgi:hypothetical protein
MDRVERWAPVGGIAFVALMVVGSMLVSDVPAPDAPEPVIVRYLADGANHMRNIVGAYLWAIGALTFLWFLVRLRSDLRAAEGGTRAPLSHLTFGAGVAFAAVWMASAGAFASVAYAVALRDAPVTDPDLVRVLPPMGRLMLLWAGFAGLLLLLATATAILRTGVLPRWLAWLGIVAAVALLFDLAYGQILPFWTWVFIASIVMLVRRERTAIIEDGGSIGSSTALESMASRP